MVKPFTGGAKGVKVNGILLTPLAVTKDNLNVIVDKGWITKAEVCAGVKPSATPFASEPTAPCRDVTNEGGAALLGGAAHLRKRRMPDRRRRRTKQTRGESMTSAAPGATSTAPNEPAIRRLLRATRSMRMLGMIGALVLIWVGFNLHTVAQTGESLFLTPRNLVVWVQTSSIAIMATGMVLIIVMRRIDLSVGSIIGFVSTIVGVAQVRILPISASTTRAIWILAVLIALALGAAIGDFHGSLVAYLGIPAFIVTLGAQFVSGAAQPGG